MKYTSLSLKFTGSSEIKIYYAISESNTTHPDFKNIGTLNDEHGNYGNNTWYYNKIPNWRGAKGTYVWQRTLTEFSDGRTENIAACLEIRQAAELVVQTYQANDTNQNNTDLKNIYYEDIADWCGKTGTTIISGSEIFTNSITSEHLTSNALKSENYNPGAANTLIPQGIYPLAGSYFDFKKGNFYSPSFVVKTGEKSNDNQAYFKGNINANSGFIGNWKIEGTYLYGVTTTTEHATTKYDVGMSSSAWPGDPAFWAGHNNNAGNTPWGDDNWGANTNFYVTNTGHLVAKSADISGTITATGGSFDGTITARKGNIGGLTINESVLSSDNFILGTNNGTTYLSIGSSGNNTIIDNSGITTTYFKAGALDIHSTYLYYGGDPDTIGSVGIDFCYIPNPGAATTISKNFSISLSATTRSQGSGYHMTTFTATLTGDIPLFPIKISYWAKIKQSDTSSETSIYRNSFTFTSTGEQSLNYFYSSSAYSPISSYGLTIDGVDKTDKTQSITQYNTPPIAIKGDFVSKTPGQYNLGNSTYYWADLFTVNYPTGLSDRNEKNSIINLSDSYSQVFDKLVPVSYKFNKNTSDRTHLGFIAQDVEQALLDVGLTTKDFAGICYWDKEDGTKGYGLRYGEFIPLNTHEIQKLKKRVTGQDQRILELEEKLSNLEKLIQPSEN